MNKLSKVQLLFILYSMLNPLLVNASELMEVDRGFNEMAQNQGIARAFDHYLAKNALNLNGGYDAVTRSEVVADYHRRRDTLKMKWWPVTSKIATSGELGYTWGRFIEYTTQDDGKVEEIHGKYITVWQKDEQGQWKSLTDMGAINPPPGTEKE